MVVADRDDSAAARESAVSPGRQSHRGVALLLILTAVAGLDAAHRFAGADDSASPPAESSPEFTAEQLEFFEKKVRPVLVENCFGCHGPEQQKGGLRLDSRALVLKGGETGSAVVPGKPDDSELVAAIRYDANGYQMPPAGKLPQPAIDALTAWVRMGAPWPAAPGNAPDSPDNAPDAFDLEERAGHWSFQPVRRPRLPAVQQTSWPRNPVDHFVLARMEAAGLSPAERAGRRTLIRRVTFDLTGLPPTPAEVDAFLADDAPGAWERLVDRLLESPQYGERWARHWLDLVRFAETAGHEFDYEIDHAWQYRDYVVRAFNQDVPYNQLLLEHLAGDLLPEPRKNIRRGYSESLIGTAFYWLGQGKHSPVDLRAEECDRFDNQIDVISKTFLGLTVACARCHDHKFDPITTQDYYALAGYLQSSRYAEALLQDDRAVAGQLARLTELRHRIGRLTLGRQEEVLLDQQQYLARLLEACFTLAPQVAASPGNAQSEKRIQPEGLPVAATEELRGWLASQLAPGGKPVAPLQHAATGDLLQQWLALARVTASSSPDSARKKLADRIRRQVQAAEQTRPGEIEFDDFSADSYSGWFASGQAFGNRPTRGGELVAGTQTFLPEGLADSGRVADRLQGSLKSQTFEITQPFIWYRVARRGGRPSPGRKLRNGQIHLIVDSFEFIRSPLYGNLTLNIPGDGQYRWHRQDVSRFLGSRAWIELHDEETNGSLSVDRIVFSRHGQPPEAAASEMLELLEDRELITVDQLAGALAEQIRQTARCGLACASAAAGIGHAATVTGIAAPRLNAHEAQLLSTIETGPFLKLCGQQLPAQRQATVTRPDLQRAVALAKQLEEQLPIPQKTLAIEEGTPENEFVLIRGNHRKPGKPAPRANLEVFRRSGEPAASQQEHGGGSGRLELARRLASADNPLTARVIVNRLWQHHFGSGLVATPDNFGVLGQQPSHPELLDWLAAELVHREWSLKAMHRLMLTSATWQMTSQISDEASEERDPQNRLLHRMPVRRLEAEAIRDAMLAVSGSLDPMMAGPGVLPHLTPFMEGRGRPGKSGPLDGQGRRSLYINVRRNFLTPLFLAFDYPTPQSSMGRRSVSNVPSQALTLMNSDFVIQQSRAWAQGAVLAQTAADLAEVRASSGPGAQDGESLSRRLDTLRIQRLYRAAFARPAYEGEVEAARGFVVAQAEDYPAGDLLSPWADLCHVLLNVKEFLFIR